MKLKISKSVWDASGQDSGNAIGTLNWILGYIDPNNANVNLFSTLDINQTPSITIDVPEYIVHEIKSRFGSVDEKLVSTLLVIAYVLGGQE